MQHGILTRIVSTKCFPVTIKKDETRMVLHASLADVPSISSSKDTDVLLLMTYANSQLNPCENWYTKYEHQRYANIKTIISYLGGNVACCLMQFHSITGCDIISYFYSVGKITVMRKILKGPGSVNLIEGLGKKKVLSFSDLIKCQDFLQRIMYAGTQNEEYAGTRIRLDKETRKDVLSPATTRSQFVHSSNLTCSPSGIRFETVLREGYRIH